MDENLENIDKEITKILTEAYSRTTSHQKGAKILEALCRKSNFQEFCDVLTEKIKSILIIKPPNIYANKCTTFLAMFFTLLNEKEDEKLDDKEHIINHPIFEYFLEVFLKAQAHNREEVRYWTCDIINKIINNMEFMSEETCDRLKNAMLDRLKDPKIAIRLKAIECLYRLQNPTDIDNDIVKEFLNLIQTDASAKIRKNCIDLISLRDKDVIPIIIEKIRDVDENVRLAAFQRLKIIPNYLKVIDKRQILNNGFLNSSAIVKDFMKILLKEWLSFYNNNILSFIRELQIDLTKENFEEVLKIVEMVLQHFFRMQNVNEHINLIKDLSNEKLIIFNNLNKETSIYWRMFNEYLLKKPELNQLIDEILPELSKFCVYIKSFTKEIINNEYLDKQYILKQLFLITKSYDMNEIAGRNNLNSLISELLQNENLHFIVTKTIVDNLEYTISNDNLRCHYINEIIQNIKMPINEEDNVKDKKIIINNKIMELNKNKLDALEKEDYQLAELLKNNISELEESLKSLQIIDEDKRIEMKNDDLTIIKCLNIIEALLTSAKIKKINEHLKILMSRDVIPNLIHDNDFITNKSLLCYALLCILDKSIATNGIHLLSKPIFSYHDGDECNIDTLLVCIKGVVDLLRVFGGNLIAHPTDEEFSESISENAVKLYAGGTSLSDIVQGLVDLMNDENEEIQLGAVRGLCILISERRVHSENLLSLLIIKWWNPATECEKIKYFIGATLENITKIQNYGQYIEKATLTTIQTVVYAPHNSPLRDIVLDELVKFLVTMSKVSPLGEDIHQNLAFEVYNEMDKAPRKSINYIYSKLLLLLLKPKDKDVITELLSLYSDLVRHLKDKMVKNNIKKYIAGLEKEIETEGKSQEIQVGEKCNEKTTQNQQGDESQEEDEGKDEQHENEDEGRDEQDEDEETEEEHL